MQEMLLLLKLYDSSWAISVGIFKKVIVKKVLLKRSLAEPNREITC